ncbi:hypothetical protein [Bacillus sp. FJAT-52991]|uniref:SLH domain-containing protein n=1 Tax=Bacillus kandeliae TaxID=3129297 RepID=A0ABZ2N2Q0_9BACI
MQHNTVTGGAFMSAAYLLGSLESTRFKEAQDWVKANKISDGTYPQRPVTREEVWEMMYRASKINK